MTMSRRALIALGVGQCVNWGVLYYAFAVLLLPVAQQLRRPAWVVAGAFSLALLMSAALAPQVGAWCDRNGGPLLMQVGGFTAALTLAVWTVAPGVVALYAIWAVLGLCMAATLYEPAFVIVGRSVKDPGQRLRALAAVTLFGGLASTVFLPGTAFLVGSFGWRSAVLILASALAISTAAAGAVLRAARGPSARVGPSPGAVPTRMRPGAPPRFATMSAIFAAATLASAGLGANLIPALDERGIPPSSAAMLGGLIGVMQLPGRAVLMNGGFRATPSGLLTLSLVLSAFGFVAVALAPSTLLAAAGLSVFGLGAGLTTLVRPQLVQDVAAAGDGGYWNGRIARQQHLARAAGPLVVATLGGAWGYGAVFATLAGLFILCATGWQSVRKSTGRVGQRDSGVSGRGVRPSTASAVFLCERGRQARPPGGVVMKANDRRGVNEDTERRDNPQAAGCCGGPAPASTSACCADDAAVKRAGGSGCGCGSGAVEPTRQKSSCCA